MKRNGTRRLLAGLLALVMVLVLLPTVSAQAEDGVVEIGSYTELKAFAARVNGGEYGLNAKITSDFTCPTATDWTPICPESEHGYTGTFNGNNCVITGLKFNQTITSDATQLQRWYIGLFGVIETGGTVQDLYLKDCSIQVSVSAPYFNLYEGAVAGRNFGTITACGVFGEGEISGVRTGGDKSANAFVGGIAGYNNGIITDSCFIGTVNVQSNASSKGFSPAEIGGIAGRNPSGGNRTAIENCFHSGSVIASGGDFVQTSVGGIVGTNYAGLRNCRHNGSVQGVESKSNLYNSIGGVAGTNGVQGIIIYCYARSAVEELEGGSGLLYLGGVVGANNGGSTSDCFCDTTLAPDTEAIGYVGSGSVSDVVGLASEAFADESNFSGWENFDMNWVMGVDQPEVKALSAPVRLYANSNEDVVILNNIPVCTPVKFANPFTYEGHEFTGWNTQADGDGVPYSEDDEITLLPGETFSLSAQWRSTVVEYPLWVGGVQVTSANADDVLNDGGTVKFEVTDEGENVLTLNNANVTACGTFDGNTACIYYGRVATGQYHDSLTLCLIGENTLYDAADYGIKTAGSSGSMYQETNDLVITGEGALTADCVKTGLSVHGTIDVSGVTVTARGNADNGIYSLSDITITDSTITAEAGKNGIFTTHKLTIGGESYVIADSAGSNAYEAVYAMDGVVLNDGMAVADPANGYVQDGRIYQTDGTEAKHVVIGKAYPLWVGTVQVNVLNKDDILNDGGTAKFEITDEGENVLTLSNWKLENFVYTGIRAEGIDLTINGSAEIGVNGENAFAIYVGEGDLTLDGNFTLRANTLYNTTLAVAGYLTVEGGALDVENTAEGRFTIIVLRGMTVNGGTVHAKANGARAIVTPSGIILNNGETYLLGDANASEVKIGVPVEYTITFVNEDGTELQSGEVLLGETPAYTGEEPTKPATAQYTYTFAGWKDENGIVYGLTDDLPAVTGEMTYTAIYTSTVNEYTITFVNEDGTVLQEELVAYGETPEYNGETPTKEKTLRYEYTFAGWDPEIVPVTGDATYTAVFTESLLHPIFICGDVDAMDAVVKERDETLYRYDVTVTDLLDGAVEVNSAQIFLTYDHDKLELKRGEGAVDWTINDADELLSAAWASDSTTTLKNGDVVLTLYFAAKNVAPGETVAIGFAQNNLGLGSALSFVEEGETTEFFAKTQDGSITFAMPDAVTIAGADVLSGDIYAIENGKLLYRYDLRMKDLPEAGLWINSAQIFVEFDHAILALARTEGAFDWTVTENGDKLMAVWASDEDVQINEDDVVLTLWFEKIGEAPEDGRVPIVFTTNLLGNTSAVSIAFFGTVTELETNTVDGSITFEEVVYGDANCDGMVTSADAALILRAIVGLSELSMRGALNADVDGDMEVTAADAALILRYVVGLVGSLPA